MNYQEMNLPLPTKEEGASGLSRWVLKAAAITVLAAVITFNCKAAEIYAVNAEEEFLIMEIFLMMDSNRKNGFHLNYTKPVEHMKEMGIIKPVNIDPKTGKITYTKPVEHMKEMGIIKPTEIGAIN